MPAIHIRMRDTAEHSEILPIFPQHFEVRRQRVVAPAVFREEMLRQQTKVVADSKHPARLSAGCLSGRESVSCSTSECRRHRVQQWQRKKYTRTAKKPSARECRMRGNQRSRNLRFARLHGE